MEQQQTFQGLMKAWHPIAWSKSLKNKPISATVMDINVVVFRDHHGRAQAMEDRCIHKGIKLSKGRGTKAGIECPYHGWTFDLDGTLIDLPDPDDYPQGDPCGKVNLVEVRVGTWGSMVWYTMDDEAPELLSRFGFGWIRAPTVVEAGAGRGNGVRISL